MNADRAVKFKLIGLTPLLFHADDIESSDVLTRWRKDPANKDSSVKGDDRSPPWTWQTYLYPGTDGLLAWPQANIMAGLQKAGARIILKGNKTFKELVAGGMYGEEEFFAFTTNGKTVPMQPIWDIKELSFEEQATAVKDMGFKLYGKRAKIGQAKHIRIRARFEAWEISGTIIVTSKEITSEILTSLFEIAGNIGQGDWRPGSPKSPGPFGRFRSELKLLRQAA